MCRKCITDCNVEGGCEMHQKLRLFDHLTTFYMGASGQASLQGTCSKATASPEPRLSGGLWGIHETGACRHEQSMYPCKPVSVTRFSHGNP